MTSFLEKIKQELGNKQELVIHCKITPQAAQSKVIDILPDQTIKIAIAAAPEKGKANRELINFLSQEFGIAKFNITIISGQMTRNKLVKLKNN